MRARCGFFTTLSRLGETLGRLAGRGGGALLLHRLGAEDLLHEARVQGVAGAVGGDLADDGTADQREVTEEGTPNERLASLFLGASPDESGHGISSGIPSDTVLRKVTTDEKTEKPKPLIW